MEVSIWLLFLFGLFEMFLFEKFTKLDKMDVDDFLDDIEKNGLFGYNVFNDDISRDDLRNELLKGVDLSKYQKSINESYLYESEVSPLAVRLGLRKMEELKVKGKTNNTQSNTKPSNSSQSTTVNNGEQKVDDNAPQSYKDRIEQEKERRELARLQREEKKRQLEIDRQNRLNKTTFKGKEENNVSDDRTTDKVNQRLAKQLGLKYEPKVKPVKRVPKKDETEKSIGDLEKELADYMKTSAKKDNDILDVERKLANKMRDIKPFNRLEYSKKTLLAIADRMDFVVYCKFVKKNGEKRTGKFKIVGTKSQITPKLDSIVVKDISLPEPKNWRTIPLDRILEIKPI